MKLNIFICLVFVLLSTSVFALPSVEMTIKVTNENNEPIAAAIAGLTFSYTPSGGSPKTSSDRGLTNSDGLFTGGGESVQHFTYWATKEGYYTTIKEHRLNKITGIMGFRRWEPWNPTIEVVLKKKVNPIAMYAYNMNQLTKTLPELPVLNRFVGFDLIARDWVVPHGLGTHRDILFKLEQHKIDNYKNYSITFTVAFENEGDGLQSYYAPIRGGSQLRMPHHAPTTGYEPMLVINKKRTTTKILSGKRREDQNYFFRVRTERDDKGNITSALYGKIYGSISPAGFVGTTSKVRFSYYLNPTPNDTNVEFDPEKNLFKDLTVNEQVFKP